MKVYWLEQTQADVPKGSAWLSGAETAHLSVLRFPKRRADWLLGRWTAKNAVAIYLGLSIEACALGEIEIRPAVSGAPEVFHRGRAADVTISISHRDGNGACAVAPPDVLLGCDLETIEAHSDAFATDYFTAEEQALVNKASAKDRFPLLALLWSGKESALKALREGLRLDTRNVIVRLPEVPESQRANERDPRCRTSFAIGNSSGHNSWSPLQVVNRNGQVFHGWWSQTASLIRTMLADPPSDAPIHLVQCCSEH
jgi:4'-phosphopantetheinyl transferase